MRGIVAGLPGNVAAGVAARSAQEQAGNWCSVLRRFVGRTHHEHLVHRKFGVMPVAAGDTVLSLKIGRCQELLVDNLFAKVSERERVQYISILRKLKDAIMSKKKR